MSTPDYSYAFPWEREAMQGAEMPDGLSMYDQMAYISLRTLYHDYHEKRMDRATASAEKRRIFGAWDRAKRTAEFERKLAFFQARKMQSVFATCWMGWRSTDQRKPHIVKVNPQTFVNLEVLQNDSERIS